jgi:hypothetical protein
MGRCYDITNFEPISNCPSLLQQSPAVKKWQFDPGLNMLHVNGNLCSLAVFCPLSVLVCSCRTFHNGVCCVSGYVRHENPYTFDERRCRIPCWQPAVRMLRNLGNEVRLRLELGGTGDNSTQTRSVCGILFQEEQ